MIKALREALSCATAAFIRPAYSSSNGADKRRKVVNFKQIPWVVPAGQSIESRAFAASNLVRKPGFCGSAAKQNICACEMVAAAGPDSSESIDKCRQMRRCLSKNFLYPAAMAGHKTPGSPHEWPIGPNAGIARNAGKFPAFGLRPPWRATGRPQPVIRMNGRGSRMRDDVQWVKFPAFGLQPPWRATADRSR